MKTHLLAATALLSLSCSVAWRPFAPPDGGFTVMMPGTPEERVQTIQTTDGTVEKHLYTAIGGRFPWEKSTEFYTVAYTAVAAAADPQRLLTDARDRMVSEIGGSVVKEESVILGSHQGLEVLAKSAGATMIRARIYVANGRVYEVVIGGKAEKLYSPERGHAFLDSFRLMS